MSKNVKQEERKFKDNALWKQIDDFLGEKISLMEETFYCYSSAESEQMQETIGHIMTRGKRLRPLLMLLCGSLEPSKDDDLIKASAATELIHTASLIHDDIIDSSSTRRGKPTINFKWGNKSAVLAGDFLFARAFELLSLCNRTDLNEYFTWAIGMMCQGEIDQNKIIFNTDLNEEQYLDNIYRKTAVLIETCCGAGARLSLLGEANVEKIKNYGRYFGLAFQIIDDLLDVTAEPALTGKPATKDLKEGVITLPLIYVLRDPVWGPYLEDAIERRDFSAPVLKFLQHPSCRSGPLKCAHTVAISYIHKAKESLAGYKQNHAAELLEAMADQVLLQHPDGP